MGGRTCYLVSRWCYVIARVFWVIARGVTWGWFPRNCYVVSRVFWVVVGCYLGVVARELLCGC